MFSLSGVASSSPGGWLFLGGAPISVPRGRIFCYLGAFFFLRGLFRVPFQGANFPLMASRLPLGGSTFCTACFLFSLGGSLCPSVLPLFRSGRLPANLYRAAAPLSHRGVGFCSKKFAFSFERLTFPLQRHLFVTWGVCISPRRVVCFALSGRVTFFLP